MPTYRITPCHSAVGAYLPSYTVSHSRSNTLLFTCLMKYLGKWWFVCGIFNTVKPLLSVTWGIIIICLQRKTFRVPRIWSFKNPNFKYLYETQPAANNGKKSLVHCSSIGCRRVVRRAAATTSPCINVTYTIIRVQELQDYFCGPQHYGCHLNNTV